MPPSFEQPISSLTADLTKEQDVSLADLNSQVSAIAKEIKRSNRHPDAVKEALRLVGKMHELATTEPNESIIEIDQEKLGTLTIERFNKDLAIFTSRNQPGEKVRFVYNEKGDKIGRPEGYASLGETYSVGDYLAMKIEISSGQEGILVYTGKSWQEVFPKNGAKHVRFTNNLRGRLVFQSGKAGIISLCDANGKEIRSLTTAIGQDYSMVETLDNEYYFAERVGTKENLNSEPPINEYSEPIGKVIEIFKLPGIPFPLYQDKSAARNYYIISVEKGKCAFGPYNSKAQAISIDDRLYVGGIINDGNPRFVIKDIKGNIIDKEYEYKEFKQLQVIGGKIAFLGKKKTNEWEVVYDGKVIHTGTTHNIKELTEINGKSFFVSVNRVMSSVSGINDKFLYDEKGETASIPFKDIKHLIDLDGMPVYCAQDLKTEKWSVQIDNGLRRPLSMDFDNIFSFEKLSNTKACVFGYVGKKIIRQIINLDDINFDED